MSKQTIPFYYIVGWSDENKYYIGSRYAKGCNPSDLGTKYFTSSKLVQAKWKEKAPDIVQVLMTFDTREQALEWEQTALRNFNAHKNPMFLNLAIQGPQFTTIKRIWTDEQRKKQSERAKGKKNPKISESLKGKPKTKEHVEKVRAALKGRPNPNKGIPRTTEEKLRISEAKYKRTMTPAGEFRSCKHAAEYYGVCPTSLRKWMKKHPDKFYYL